MDVEDAAMIILSFMKPKDILHVCSVNKMYGSICSSQSFWKILYRHKFPYLSYEEKDWKDAFIRESSRNEILTYLFDNDADLCFVSDYSLNILIDLYHRLDDIHMDSLLKLLANTSPTHITVANVQEAIGDLGIKYVSHLPNPILIEQIKMSRNMDEAIDIAIKKAEKEPLIIWGSPTKSMRINPPNFDLLSLSIGPIQDQFKEDDLGLDYLIGEWEHKQWKKYCK